MSEYEQFVKCPSPSFVPFETQQFHVVPRSKSTIHEYPQHRFMVEGSRVGATIHTPPEELIQWASDALLLAEHLRERQSAVQAEKETEKDAQQLEKEAQALYESAPRAGRWEHLNKGIKDAYLTMARKAREIHGVSK